MCIKNYSDYRTEGGRDRGRERGKSLTIDLDYTLLGYARAACSIRASQKPETELQVLSMKLGLIRWFPVACKEGVFVTCRIQTRNLCVRSSHA